MSQDTSQKKGILDNNNNNNMDHPPKLCVETDETTNADGTGNGNGSSLPPFSPPAVAASPSYISSASSTTGAGPPYTPNMSTIDSAIRKDSDDVMHIPPAHPFFNQQHFVYDSDGSDGSLVMHKPKKSAPPPKNNNAGPRKERFPSFDSMASSGSLRFVPSASPGKNQQPINPHLLPYHERRKLKQQRSKQQQQQQQPTIPTPQVPPLQQQQPYRFDPRMQPQQFQNFQQQQQQFAMMMQQQVAAGGYPPGSLDPLAAAAFASMYGMPMPGYPGFPYPPPQGYPTMQSSPGQQNYANSQQPLPMPPHFPPQMQGFPPPFGMPPAPPGQQNRQAMPPQTPQQPPPQTPIQQQQQQQQQHSPPPPPPPPQQQQQQPPQPQTQHQQRHLSPYRSLGKQERPPKGNSVPRTAASPRPPISGGGKSRPQLNSVDSSESSAVNLKRRNEQPPPPPPPPANSSYHVRLDSVGSVSSLGSTGAGLGEQDEMLLRMNANVNGGFLDMLRSWSPKQQQQPNVIDFHRKNQEFLQNSQRNRPGLPSPKSSTSHRRVPSEDRPPASRGTHKRLDSITNDDWEEKNGKSAVSGTDASSEGSGYSSSDTSASRGQAGETTSLLPAAGISTNELDGKDFKHQRRKHSSRRRTAKNPGVPTVSASGNEEHLQATSRWDNRTATAITEQAHKSSSRKHRKKKHKSRRKSRNDEDQSDSSDSSYDYHAWSEKRARMLEKERNKLIEQWKAEARMEAEQSRREEEANRWEKRAGRSFAQKFRKVKNRSYRAMTLIEAFIANLPLTIGAIALAVVTLGTVWFKFVEENIDTCEPVHFHSSQCTFPEYPGCFYCDTNAPLYKMAIYFHWACKVTAGTLAMLFVAKVLVATRIVLDEMSQPTSASPAGLLCMTTVCVFAGRGLIGQAMVTSAACIHLCIVVWFIYMSLAYRIMPDPSWYPNTVGVGLTAVKTWLYYPMPGHLLMAISLSLNLCFFPISLIRVVMNQKISATVAWMQMGAPSISLYALTIMAQPTFEEEHPDVTQFQRVHRMIYLPCMHVMCFLSILGFLASVLGLCTRWSSFKKKSFSPAHAAFCFPTLSHANAIQAYRGAIISFSDIHLGSWRMAMLYSYWLVVLLTGTIFTLWVTARFLCCLPSWTNFDVDDEEEPPAPFETFMSRQDLVTVGEVVRQPFVSPAILQANETGALVLARNAIDGSLRYVRTRRVKAIGFEPTMDSYEMQSERETLMEYIGTHPSRRRNRTLSVPGIDFNYGSSLGTGNAGVYGAIGNIPLNDDRHMRIDSESPLVYY